MFQSNCQYFAFPYLPLSVIIVVTVLFYFQLLTAVKCYCGLFSHSTDNNCISAVEEIITIFSVQCSVKDFGVLSGRRSSVQRMEGHKLALPLDRSMGQMLPVTNVCLLNFCLFQIKNVLSYGILKTNHSGKVIGSFYYVL